MTLSPRKIRILLLSAILLLAAILRVGGMTAGLWYDEMLSHDLAQQGIGAILYQVKYPLSYLIIWLFQRIGDSEVLLRMHSYIAGLLAVWLIYFAGRAWHSVRTGITASFLLTLSACHTYYSHEGRFYALVMLAAVLLIWGLKGFLDARPRRGDWVLVISGIAIGSLSHLMFLPYIATLMILSALALLLTRRDNLSHRVKSVAKLALASLLALLPWFIVYFAPRHKESGPLALLATASADKRQWLLTIQEYKTYLTEILYMQVPDHAGPMAWMAAAGAIFLCRAARARALPIIATPLLLPIPFLFIPVAHFYAMRYFTPLLPGMLLLVAVFLVDAVELFIKLARRLIFRTGKTTPSPSLQRATSATLVIVISVLTATYFARNFNSNRSYDQSRTYATLMAPYVSSDDVIIHFAPYQLNPGNDIVMPWPEFALNFYLDRVLVDSRRDIQPHKTLITIDPADVRRCLEEHPDSNIWLVHWRSTPVVRLDPDMEQHFKLLQTGTAELFQFAGAQTTNLLTGTDFESGIPADLNITGNATIVTDEHADHRPGIEALPFSRTKTPPGNCLQITPADDGTTSTAAFKVQHIAAPTTATVLQPTLNSSQDYVLSCLMRYERVAGHAHRTGTATVSLSGIDPHGNRQRVHLDYYFWFSPWKFQSIPIRHTNWPQVFTWTDLHVEFHCGAGLIQLDNIQLEPRKHPTPYINGTRPPHTLALAPRP